jgi:hypothetical protein
MSVSGRGPSFAQYPHLWLWVPGRASLARDDINRFNFQTATPPRSRRVSTRVLPSTSHPLNQKAQGIPGARRARSLACKSKKHTSVVTTVTPASPGIPRAMVLTVSFVLSPVTGLVCHRRKRKISSAKLDASVGASGPHDFAVRIKRVSSTARLPRVHRIPSHVRDDRETPLCLKRDAQDVPLIWG